MIYTERLLLRPHTLQDTASIFQLATDPTVSQFIRGLPTSHEEAWQRLQRYAGHWSLLGFGIFAVFERATGQFVGEVGLADFQRGVGADFDGTPEAAWLFTGASHGRGYAYEAMTAALTWMDGQRASTRRVCIIDVKNAASIKLAAKLGFKHYGDANYRGAEVGKYERG